MNIVLLIVIRAEAQQAYNCIYQQHCNWNAITEQYDECQEGHGENSSFEINKSESSITQTIQNIKTIYSVKSKERNRKEGVNIYLVMNEAGDKYYYIFDKKNKEVRILSKNDGKAALMIYSPTNPTLTED